jgi:hypothetical protein
LDDFRLNIEKTYGRFISGIDDRCNESLNYIDKLYPKREEFYRVNAFSRNLISLITGQSQQGAVIRLFASADSMVELENSLNLALSFQYKSAFDSLRRALEITVLGVYFDLVENDFEKIFNWIHSQVDTPPFSRMVDKISSIKIFIDLNIKFGWKDEIKNYYWKLCDYTHTKGLLKSITELNKTNYFKSKQINLNALNEFLSDYIETIQNIALIYSTNHPILLVGLPILEKFGFKMSIGLFNDLQATNLKQIIPEKYNEYFDNLLKTSDSIQTQIESINKMPISEDYIKIQEILKSIKDNKNEL